MIRKEFFVRLAGLIVCITVFNFLANKFYWYSSIWYFDIFMHFLGGLWLGGLFLWLFWPNKLSTTLVAKVIAGVLLVGIGWEIFELMFVNYVAQNSFDVVDTSMDLVLDVLGGLSAILYFNKKIINSLGKTI